MKIERGFAKCPARGCPSTKVLYVGVEKSGGVTLVGLVSDDMTHLVHTNNPSTLRKNGVYCEDHGRGFVFSRVRGVLNPDVECTARCRASIRPDCECSCAGKNHGRSAM